MSEWIKKGGVGRDQSSGSPSDKTRDGLMASEADRERDISYDDAERTSVLMQRSKGILKKKKIILFTEVLFYFRKTACFGLCFGYLPAGGPGLSSLVWD